MGISNGYIKGKVDKILFVKKGECQMMIALGLRKDDIVFGCMLQKTVDHFIQQMQSKLLR